MPLGQHVTGDPCPLPVIAEHAAAVNIRGQLLTPEPGLGLLIAGPQLTGAENNHSE